MPCFPNKLVVGASLIYALFVIQIPVKCEAPPGTRPCILRYFGYTSVVCVCNATYCDELDPIPETAPGKYVEIVSSLAGQRFEVFEKELENDSSDDDGTDVELLINSTIKYQSLFGFGGAFTDSAGMNLVSVSSELQTLILRSYFSESGLNYTFARVPIAGTDFSTRKYSYNDAENDTLLNSFELAVEDTRYKIPYISDAIKLKPGLKLLAAAWSSPKWMKTNHEFEGYGFLKTEYYQLWADYLIRFIQEYESHNLTLWGLSTQNEPFDGQVPHFPFNCLGWTAEQQRDWIKNNLGPTLHESGFGTIKLIILDDQRSFVNSWCRTILDDPDAAKYVSGIGLHWYMDSYYPASILEMAHSNFPIYFMLATEACVGSNPGEHQVLLGSWERGEEYAHSIIEDLNNWVTGWIDWNLVLDMNGGPSWAENFVDAPVIVDSATDVAYKQPMYYMLGHFSKFVPEDSVRVHYEIKTGGLDSTMRGLEILTVQRPNGDIVVVVLNKLSRPISLTIKHYENDQGFIKLVCGPRSIRTILSRFKGI